MSPVVRNEQTKLLATAINNVGVACIATAGIAPVVSYFIGSVQIDDPLRLLAFGVLCIGAGRLL